MTLQAQTSRVAFAAMCRGVATFARRAGRLQGGHENGASPLEMTACPSLSEEALRAFAEAADKSSDAVPTAIFELAEEAALGTAPTGASSGDDQLWSLFETVRLDAKTPLAPVKRKPIEPLSVRALFPRDAEKRREAVSAAYAGLWRGFAQKGGDIPEALRKDWPLWLDAFDTLWLTFAQAVPAAAGKAAKPDVSLYDHAKVSAALAAALWRWCEGTGFLQKAGAQDVKAALHDEPAFLLIQGDFFGIQNFIFSGASETNKKAAKMLRGRSFYVSLLTEACAVRIMDALALPPTSQLMNAAGKFLIVAPNTEDVRTKLEAVRREVEAWFVRHTCAEAGMGIVAQPAALKDFAESAFPNLMKGLFEQLERAKLRRFDLCGDTTVPVVLDAAYPLGACSWQGCWPADRQAAGGLASCAISRDEIKIGEALVANDLLVLVRPEGEVQLPKDVAVLELPVFGLRACFTTAASLDALAGSLPAGVVRRVWDFSMPTAEDEVLWHGFARRPINGYVPKFEDVAPGMKPADDPRFAGLDPDDVRGVLPFDWIARSDLTLDEHGQLQGVDAVCCLKGDVDHLGRIFQEGLRDKATGRGACFAKMAALSREVNAFFAVVAPWLCRKEFRSVYTVFAGGDDFTFIGPIRQTQRFAETLRDRFERFVTGNPEIHFSVGMTVVKPGGPVGRLADQAEEALGTAKASGRNRVSVFGRTVDWKTWASLKGVEEALEGLRETCSLSSSYLYQLFDALEQSERRDDPKAAVWRSRLYYQTTRNVRDGVRQKRLSGDPKELTTQLLQTVCGNIETHRGDMRIPLTNLFYRIRRRRG